MRSGKAVVVTGIGAITPLGPSSDALWDGLLRCRSGVRTLTEDWVADLPVGIAALVESDPAELLGRVGARSLDRAQQFALVAAREAWIDAGSPAVDPLRLAVVIGSGVGGVLTLLSQYERLNERGLSGVSPFAITRLMPNGSAVAVGLELGARAGVHAPVSACASGAEAIVMGLDLIRAGHADVVVCGGVEAPIHRVTLAAFCAARALSRRSYAPATASRPFDKGRDGFVLGEGAGILVLESADHASRRGQVPHAELAGAAVTADSYHLVQPDPTGAGAARAMRGALHDAGVAAEAVVHINAHATSTVLGDAAEAAAIRATLGDATDGVAVSATKSVTGHLMGGAGAVEAVATVFTVRDRLAPAHPNLDDLDDEIRLDVVWHTPRVLAPGVALSNSFGFGGHNVTLAFRQAGQRPAPRP